MSFQSFKFNYIILYINFFNDFKQRASEKFLQQTELKETDKAIALLDKRLMNFGGLFMIFL
jgi:hypothetical protein